MINNNNLIVFLVLCLLHTFAFGQVQKPVNWSYAAKRLNATEGMVYINGTIDKGWHIYSTVQPDGGPRKTVFDFTAGKS